MHGFAVHIGEEFLRIVDLDVRIHVDRIADHARDRRPVLREIRLADGSGKAFDLALLHRCHGRVIIRILLCGSILCLLRLFRGLLAAEKDRAVGDMLLVIFPAQRIAFAGKDDAPRAVGIDHGLDRVRDVVREDKIGLGAVAVCNAQRLFVKLAAHAPLAFLRRAVRPGYGDLRTPFALGLHQDASLPRAVYTDKVHHRVLPVAGCFGRRLGRGFGRRGCIRGSAGRKQHEQAGHCDHQKLFHSSFPFLRPFGRQLAL